MDFVVVGLGLGACAMLAGVILLGWSLPRAERVQASSSLHARTYAEERVAAIRGAGQVMLSAGGAILLATIGALAGSLDDRTGAFFVVTTVTVAALGILVWGFRILDALPWLAPRPRARKTPPRRPDSLTALPVVLAAPAPAPNGMHAAPGTEHIDGPGQDDIDRIAAPDAPSEFIAVILPDPSQDETEDLREEVAVGGSPAQAGPDD